MDETLESSEPEIDGSVRVLRLNRPEARNALSIELRDRFSDAVDAWTSPRIPDVGRRVSLDRRRRLAITVLAGSNLLASRATSTRVDRLAPFIEGLVTLAWVTATFWFPFMVAIGIWRHIVGKVPLHYHPPIRGLVFPLGMHGEPRSRCEPPSSSPLSSRSPRSASLSPSPHGHQRS